MQSDRNMSIMIDQNVYFVIDSKAKIKRKFMQPPSIKQASTGYPNCALTKFYRGKNKKHIIPIMNNIQTINITVTG